MSGTLSATSHVTIDAPPADVWEALTDPDRLSRVMLGAQVESDWREGSPITFSGEWQGKPYRDEGEIERILPERELAYTHRSPAGGQHLITYTLSETGAGTDVTLTQDNVSDAQEQQHSEQTWSMMLQNLKKVVEDDV